MTLKEIEKRLSEIKEELESPEADIDALNKEVDNLIEERKKIIEKAEERKKTLERIKEIPLEAGEHVVKKEEERAFGRDSKEYRSAYLKKIRGLELSEVEKRAFTSNSASAGAAIPTQTANEIIKKMKQYAPLLEEITLLQVSGNVKFAVEDTVADAEMHAENGAITPTTDKLKEVTLGSYEITKLVQVSKTVATMSIDAFEAWLVDMIAEKVSEKINSYLVNGTGENQPTGIEKTNTWGADNSITVGASASLTSKNVQDLIGLLNGAYDKNAKFLMNKKTLFTDFMPLQDNSKNSIVTVQGNKYFVYGYPVQLDDNVATHDAYLGDLKKIIGNLSEAINIVFGFDINTNSFKYLGCAMFDSKTAVPEAFVKLKKATS